MPAFPTLRRLVFSAALSVALAAAARPAAAQTWTGNAGISWATAGNWSPVGVPTSSANTALTFGAATNYTSDQGAAFPSFTVNSMTFTSAAASAYTIQDFAINFLDNATTFPSLTQNSSRNVTFTNGLTLSSTLFLPGGGAGTLFLNGQLSGAGQIQKNGDGTTVLGAANTFGGDVTINGGVLSITNVAAIPAGRSVFVNAGSTFRIDPPSTSGTATLIGTVKLTGGTLRVPAGNVDYYANRVSASLGGAVDFTGASAFWLHLNGAGAGIDVAGNATWTGGGTSRIQNDTGAPINLAITGGTLNSSILLGRADNTDAGFNLINGGTLNQTAAGSTAPMFVDASFYQFADPAFLTTGALTLQNTGILNYSGSTAATLAKNVTLASGGGQLVTGSGASLTVTGTISETGGTGRPLFVGGGTVVLAANNTYTGKTDVYANGVASVASIPNGGVAGPLGASSAAAANVVIDDGFLRYTGPTASTDRGLTVTTATSKLGVATAGVTLTVGGQITGTGALNKSGPGTLVLTNSTSNYTGGTVVNAGTLMLGAASADQIPSGGNVTVAFGATFDLGSPGTSGNASRPAGTITLNNGTMRAGAIPTGVQGTYTANALVQTAGTVDFSHTADIDSSTSTLFLLYLNTATIKPSGTTAVWAGPSNGLALVVPASASGLTITVGQGVTSSGIDLDSSLSMDGTGAVRPFIKAGPGLMRMTQERGSQSPLTVADGTLRMDDVRVFNAQTFATVSNSLTLAGGTFQYAGPTATAANNPLTLGTGGGGTIETPDASVTLTLPGAIGGAGGLTKAGPGTLALTNANNTYAGGTTVAAGTLAATTITGPSGQMTGATTVGAGATLVANAVVQQSLTVNGQANLRTQANGGATSAVKLLTVGGVTGAWTGRLDLADGRLVIDYTGGSPLADVADQVKSGRAGGAWTGNGIRSSLADAGRFAVGYAEASDVLGASGGTFGGQPADGTSVLVRYTLYGDANLDGVVNIADFARFQNKFNQPGTWAQGDFNDDGQVNIADFALLQNNFNQSAPNGGLAMAAAGATPADFAAVAAFAAETEAGSVPEPGAAGLVAVAAVGLLARRRHGA